MALKTFVILVVVQIVLSSGAFAARGTPYLSLGTGANLLTGDSENVNALGSFNLGFQAGYQGSLALGYRLAPQSSLGTGRIELELGYRQNKVDRITFSDGKFNASGKARVWDVMLNTFGEYSSQSRWSPYIGAGIGVAHVTLKGVEVANNPVVDDEDLVLAYQLGTGLDFALSRTVELDLGYRFFGTTKPRLKDVEGVAFDSEYYVHNFQLSVRFLF